MKILGSILLCLVSSLAWGQTIQPRENLETFVNSPQKLAALKRGVQVMKSRPPSDPTSWFFQAAIHGVTAEAIAEAADRDPNVHNVDQGRFWNQCPHDGQPSADFLIWHRAYVYYFERILREASGDPAFSLPYWDYTGTERRFPLAFARPEPHPTSKIPSNPLYSANREMAFMNGTYELSAATVTTDLLFAEERFFGPSEDQGFAGGVTDSDPRTQGMIERQPHNLLHLAIGGVINNEHNGLMADVPTAAFDPAFWVHHANIDRLWSKWDALPNRRWGDAPPRTWFEERPWQFYDADKTLKNEPRVYYIQLTQKGVRNDDDVVGPRLSDALPPEIAVAPSVPAAPLLLAGNPPSLNTLNRLSATNTLNAKLQASANIDAQKPFSKLIPDNSQQQAKRRLSLVLTMSVPKLAPTVGYDVYLKLPGQADAILKPGSPGFLGTISLFGARHQHGAGEHADHAVHATFVQKFDITRFVSNESFKPSNVEVQIKPFSLFKAVKAEDPIAERSGEIEVQNISVVSE
jgi:hypothetical protein